MDSGIDVWISDEKLIPGQDWKDEIRKAVRTSDVVLLFLSNNALTRDGYFQKELKLALEVAEQKPNGVIYIIPIRLEDCPVPEEVSRFHWINYFEDRAYAQLIKALVAKAESLSLRLPAEGLVSIRNNLKDIKDRRVPVAEAKVMVLGQGSVGKTSLVRRLLSDEFEVSENKTEGISINHWSVISNKHNYPIRLNIWDMGGQEIMQATHQFFLTKNSLYLLVLDARMTQEENRVEYWLRIIQSFAGESPVIIIGNKTDQHPLNLDRRNLVRKYPNIVEIIETSAATGAGIENLKFVIAQQASNLAHVHDLYLNHGL
jgi:small GTP-binding protein